MLLKILISRLSSHVDEIIRNISVGFDVTNQLLAGKMFCIRQIQEKKWEYNEKVHHLLIHFKKAYDSIWRELLYNILTESRVLMKLVRLITMCYYVKRIVKSAYVKVCIISFVPKMV
jgi:hypothetical protein